MSGIEAVFFDCDGTLVDSEVICSRAYVTMFQEFGITLDLEEVFKRFKGVKLYEIIDIINEEHGVVLAKTSGAGVPRRGRTPVRWSWRSFRGKRAAGCDDGADLRGLQRSGQQNAALAGQT
jgi:phosphoglycolate phosphatase-like HAD superfamily hydrolase